MLRKIFLLTVLIASLAVTNYGQTKTLRSVKEIQFDFPLTTHGRLLSVENGHSIFLKSIAQDREASIINILDMTGTLTTSLDVVKQIDGAVDAAIYDVSIGKAGIIAVSVVARNRADVPAPLLIVYDATGKLLNAQRLGRGTELGKLRVDADNSIWGIALGGDTSLLSAPIFYKYTDYGKKFNGYFQRNNFDSTGRANLVAKSSDEKLSYNGVLTFGLTQDKVWCWFPEQRELVMFNKNGDELQKLSTGMPTLPKDSYDKIRMWGGILTESGSLMMPIGFSSKNNPNREAHLYEWNLVGGWKIVSHHGTELVTRRLVGAEVDQLIFGPYTGKLSLSWEAMTPQ